MCSLIEKENQHAPIQRNAGWLAARHVGTGRVIDVPKAVFLFSTGQAGRFVCRVQKLRRRPLPHGRQPKGVQLLHALAPPRQGSWMQRAIASCPGITQGGTSHEQRTTNKSLLCHARKRAALDYGACGGGISGLLLCFHYAVIRWIFCKGSTRLTGPKLKVRLSIELEGIQTYDPRVVGDQFWEFQAHAK